MAVNTNEDQNEGAAQASGVATAARVMAAASVTMTTTAVAGVVTAAAVAAAADARQASVFASSCRPLFCFLSQKFSALCYLFTWYYCIYCIFN